MVTERVAAVGVVMSQRVTGRGRIMVTLGVPLFLLGAVSHLSGNRYNPVRTLWSFLCPCGIFRRARRRSSVTNSVGINGDIWERSKQRSARRRKGRKISVKY